MGAVHWWGGGGVDDGMVLFETMSIFALIGRV